MKRTRIAILAFLLVCQGAWGVEIDAFFSGHQILELCRAHIDGTNTIKSNICASYIAGMVDYQNVLLGLGWLAKKDGWCLPEHVTTRQLVRVVVEHMENIPHEILNDAGAAQVSLALLNTYPCN
jgi:hypothetical protein